MANNHIKMLCALPEKARFIFDLYKKEQAKLPFHINVIDELWANENAHSRILFKLLQYKADNELVLLESFIDMLPSEVPKIRTPNINCNVKYIDLLIEEPGQYAIIIENKIHGAADQLKQLERYIEKVDKLGIKPENIWIIYLTRDGSKKVGEHSLSEGMKSKLGDRFVEMNYRIHILPWLRDEVLPNCKLDDAMLISALKQYIDHLEGLFRLRPGDLGVYKMHKNKLLEVLGITTLDKESFLEDLQKNREAISTLNNAINDLYSELASQEAKSFHDISVEDLEEMYPGLHVSGWAGTFMQIHPEGWDNHVHFEWFPFDETTLLEGPSYRYCVHVEGKNSSTLLGELKNDSEVQKAINAIENKDEQPRPGPPTLFAKNYTPQPGKAFYLLSEAERKEFLSAVYNETKPLLDSLTNFFIKKANSLE